MSLNSPGIPGGRTAVTGGPGAGLNGLHNNQNSNMIHHQQKKQPGGLSGIFGIEPMGQISRRRLDFGSKRPLAVAELESCSGIDLLNQKTVALGILQQQLYLRSVRQRTGNYHNCDNASRISSVSYPVDVSTTRSFASGTPASSSSVNNCCAPVEQYLRQSNDICLINNTPTVSNHSSLRTSGEASDQGYIGDHMPRKAMTTLEELEKCLLDDDEDDVSEAASVITSTTTDWSEELEKLIGPTTVAPSTSLSPSSSSSSCSSLCSPSPSSVPIKQLIAEAATAIDEGKFGTASELLLKLSQAANMKGSPEERLAVQMSYALRSRLCVEKVEVLEKDHRKCIQNLYDHSPCFRLGVMTANLMILETIEADKGRTIHIIDFNIGDGTQYMYLIRTMKAHQSVILRISAVNTGFTTSSAAEARDRLSKSANQAGVTLGFDVADMPIDELSRDNLGIKDDEVVVVNFAFMLYRVPDESVSMDNYRDGMLRRVKGLKPRVVILLEQDMNLNTAPFISGVNEASAYYAALFESLDVTMTREDSNRMALEEVIGRKIGNAVACEGRDRTERYEVFGKWRARMGMAGFELRPIGREIVELMQGKLNSATGEHSRFMTKEVAGGSIGFGWNDRTLVVASSWH
ncbi:hypothetical protein Droror1_Dr00013188 [Drosera rotundifolia]